MSPRRRLLARFRRGWSWPHRFGEQGAGLLVAAVVVIVGLAVVAAWRRGPATAPTVFAAAPTRLPPATTPPAEPWPGGVGDSVPARSESTRFTALSGVGCPATSEAGYHIAYPAGSLPDTRRGGWAGNGCAGVFWAVPMSGTTVDEPDTYVLWWFAPRSMSQASCDLMMYVPRTDRPQDAAGTPSGYVVLRGRDDQTVVGTFSIDQTANRGRWVSAGRYALDKGQLAVKLINRGLTRGDRHAAAQAAIDCTRQ